MADPTAAAMVRGLILLELAGAHPGSLLEPLLRDQVGALSEESRDEKLWASNLRYLQARGFATVTQRVVRGRELHSWTATADGLNIADGYATDAGVQIPG